MLYCEFPEEYFYPVVAKYDLVETMTRSTVVECPEKEEVISPQEVDETTSVTENIIEDTLDPTEEARIQENAEEVRIQEDTEEVRIQEDTEEKILEECDEEYANIGSEEEEEI